MNCKNCNTEITEKINYCPQCGARIIKNRLTPTVLVNQLNEEVLSLDNKFLATFIDLFKRPERVIDGFIFGLRKRYLNVITYYAISLSLLGLQIFILKSFFPEFLDSQSIPMEGDLIASGSDSIMKRTEVINNYIFEYQNVVFTVLMPLLAIGSWIVYLDKQKYNYTEHLVMNIYINAQWIFIGFVFTIGLALFNISDFLMASLLATPISIAYGSYVFKRIFETSFLNALLRYMAAFFIYMVAFGVITIGVIIIALLYLAATGKLN